MIHPTRTNLLGLKEKERSVAGSVAILKARRQAMIREFLATVVPFARSREEVKKRYAAAMAEMRLALGHEGRSVVESLEGGVRDLGVEIAERSVMGLRYRDVTVRESPVRGAAERGYDYRSTSPHLEEALYRFETIVEEMLVVAAIESRLKRLGDEIRRVTRRIRVLEERIQPQLRGEVKAIAQYLAERESEEHYRLKRFKEMG